MRQMGLTLQRLRKTTSRPWTDHSSFSRSMPNHQQCSATCPLVLVFNSKSPISTSMIKAVRSAMMESCSEIQWVLLVTSSKHVLCRLATICQLSAGPRRSLVSSGPLPYPIQIHQPPYNSHPGVIMTQFTHYIHVFTQERLISRCTLTRMGGILSTDNKKQRSSRNENTHRTHASHEAYTTLPFIIRYFTI